MRSFAGVVFACRGRLRPDRRYYRLRGALTMGKVKDEAEIRTGVSPAIGLALNPRSP
jgi:hypothetical protein